jgi:hypothetical protein
MFDMATLHSKHLAALGLCLACLSCSEPEISPAPIASAAPAATVAAAEPVAHSESTPVIPTVNTVAHTSDSVKPTPADAAAKPEEEQPEPPTAAYQAPFPERVDLFVPPKRQGGVVLKEGETEDSVELLGFVRLDRQQVVLSINGQITPMAEGATQNGIEVISIQPPKALLQRGRQRWQASLEN